MKFEIFLHYVFTRPDLFDTETLKDKTLLRNSPLYAANSVEIENYISMDTIVNESLAAFSTVKYYPSLSGYNCLVQIVFNAQADRDTAFALAPEVHSLVENIRSLGTRLFNFSYTIKEGLTPQESVITDYETGILEFNAKFN